MVVAVEDIDDDDSCRRPGSVPFKWEIEPGVPKHQPPHAPDPNPSNKLNPPPSAVQRFTESFQLTKPKLRPTRSELRLSSRLSSKAVDSSLACSPVLLPFRLFKPSRKATKQQQQLMIVDSSDDSETSEQDYASDLETLARWSSSNRKSLAPSLDSPSPPSSPKSPVDAEWAAFGLF